MIDHSPNSANSLGHWPLSQVRLVLVEPAGPLNVGAAARVMKNMGLGHLVLVNPQCDPHSTAARRMAVHGADVLAAATMVETLPEALVGCQRAIGTTGRLHPQVHTLETPEAALPWLLPPSPDISFNSALVFGPEDRGLSNEELIYTQRWIRIPASDNYPSLNLAQAVAVCSYVLHRLAQGDRFSQSPVPGPGLGRMAAVDLAPLEQIEGFSQDLETVLLKIGYLYPHTAASRMAKLRQLLHRSGPNCQELAMLRGVLRQINWALGTDSSDSGFSDPGPSDPDAQEQSSKAPPG